ncbi:MAG: hypothetical protein H7Z37_12590, partial [Pyrinomonadaceae bacterium]|nr:hypothetical protein [Pyrinomonadaceae bacterium]
IPFRVTVGKKIDENIVELFNRQTKQSEDVKVDELIEHLKQQHQSLI